MNHGAFHRTLLAWREKPCLLTIGVPFSGSSIRRVGILRTYYSLQSLCGWTFVPPKQHGGFDSQTLLVFEFERMRTRQVVSRDGKTELRWWADREMIFALTLDDAPLTGPPKPRERNSRYLFPGGRDRKLPERWMLGPHP